MQCRHDARRTCSRAIQDVRCIPVTTPVIGLGSITVQCRQQVNTPCRKSLRTEALMDVKETFLVPFGVHQKELACRGETRPGGSPPHSQCAIREPSKNRLGSIPAADGPDLRISIPSPVIEPSTTQMQFKEAQASRRHKARKERNTKVEPIKAHQQLKPGAAQQIR